MNSERIWTAVTTTLAAAAAAWTLHTLLSAPRQADILGRKAQDLQRIRAVATRWAREDAYRAALESRQAWRPDDLGETATRALGEGVARLSPRPAAPLADGWQLREVAVELPGVPLPEAAVFLAAAGDSLPPWRLREIEIRAAPDRGKGTVNAVLEALERKQP